MIEEIRLKNKPNSHWNDVVKLKQLDLSKIKVDKRCTNNVYKQTNAIKIPFKV